MPTYEYKCPKCDHHFELFQKMSSKAAAKCPKCGAKAVRQMSAGAGLVFKGSGFYLTDYGRAGQKKGSESDTSSAASPAASTETKSDSTKKDAPAKPDAKPKSKKKDD